MVIDPLLTAKRITPDSPDVAKLNRLREQVERADPALTRPSEFALSLRYRSIPSGSVESGLSVIVFIMMS